MPDAPQGLTARWLGRLLVVSWTPSTDPAVDGYAIDLSRDGGGSWVPAGPVVPDAGISTTTFAGYSPALPHALRIRSLSGSTPSSTVTVPVVTAPPPSLWAPGIVVNSDDESGPTEAALRALGGWGLLVVRDEFAPSTPASVIAERAATYAALGYRLQPLIAMGAGLGTADIANIAGWAKTGKIKLVEAGNELPYSYKLGPSSSAGETYGRTVKALTEALSPSGVGVLAIGEDGGTGNPAFLNGAYKAVPDLSQYVAGWTIHPYGPSGISKLVRMIAALAAHGETSKPIHVTEFGIATDDGRSLSDNYGWPVNLTYDQAVKLLAEAVGKVKAAAGGRLASFLLYQTHDQKAHGASTDREAYFGAVRSDGTPKGAFTTAVKTFLAS